MIINEKNLKMWSTIGLRATFGLTILDLIKRRPNLMMLTCDVSTSAGLDRFRKTYPDNFVDLGIAEQNMMGVAAGLASQNFEVITTTFSPFQTLRCCEQIKVNFGYMKEKVTMVGLASGLVLGNLGFTHCSIEDIGVLRSIPNIKIICPCDSLETIKAIETSVDDNFSCYIRLTGGVNLPIINKEDYEFKIGKAIELCSGNDVIIIGTGVILNEALIASKKLNNKNISTTVTNFHTVKPIDQEYLKSIANKYKLIITLEEHNIIGGLGSAVSEILSTIKNSTRLLRLGVNDYYSKSGSYDYLKNLNRLNSDNIVTAVENYLLK